MPGPTSAPHPLLGQRVTPVWLRVGRQGQSITSARAGLTVLEFWSLTCIPCRLQLRRLVSIETPLAKLGANLRLIAVLDEDETTDEARQLLAGLEVHESFAALDSEVAQKALGLSALPATWLVDAYNTLVWVAPAQASLEDIERAVAERRQ